MSLFLPNPCLLGILFTVSTHSGPLLVFHYPPTPKAYNYKATPALQLHTEELLYNNLESSSSSSSSGDESNPDAESDVSASSVTSDSAGGRMGGVGPYIPGRELLERMEERERRRARRSARRAHATGTRPLEPSVAKGPALVADDGKVFGFDVDFLSELVHPPRIICNNRFDLCVDDMSFVGMPVHVNEDGSWRTETAARPTKSKRSSKMSEKSAEDNACSEALPERDDCPMHMFHLVFVMNPPLQESTHRIDEMYHYVISRLSLILRYEQAKTNYVWTETVAMGQARERASGADAATRCALIMALSSLARAVADCYNAISTSVIANLELNGKVRSFQIPIKTDFEALPPSTVPVLPGSYLSSITVAEGSDTGDDDMSSLALLLLDNRESIITDIQAGKESVLANFIRAIKPTESLARLAALSGLDSAQVQAFASHLIYWRRARAVPPVQARNVYIVSPMAPLGRLRHEVALFKQHFPALPTLPRFLSLLSSSKPRQYSSFIPSHDHRDMYVGAIAWLLQHGYVTQLHTYVWVKISCQIKMKVDEELENEALRAHARNPAKSNPVKSSPKGSTDNSSKATSSVPALALAPTVTLEEEGDTILLDPFRATAIERRWIAKCVEGKPAEIVALFYRLLRYFDGKHPLEMVLARENIPRQELRRLISATEEYIISVKHW